MENRMQPLLKSILLAMPMALSAFAVNAADTSAREASSVRVEAVHADRVSYAALTQKMRPTEVPAAIRERSSLGSEEIVKRPINQLGIIRL
jgi:hypothetical protein